jgi:hypothetical protein
MRVRLIKKFAEKIDGVDLTDRSVGDLLNLKPSEARLLLAEQWAVPGADPSDSARSRASEPDEPRDNRSTPSVRRHR